MPRSGYCCSVSGLRTTSEGLWKPVPELAPTILPPVALLLEPADPIVDCFFGFSPLEVSVCFLAAAVAAVDEDDSYYFSPIIAERKKRNWLLKTVQSELLLIRRGR